MDGRQPADITNYGGPHSRRDVVELILFQQALIMGGLTADIHLMTKPSYSRIIMDLQNGDVAATGDPLWQEDLKKIKNDVFISIPLVKLGDFEAGLYTSRGNQRALQANTLAKVRDLSAVCNRNWTADWATLTQMKLRNLTHIQQWPTMVRNVALQRSDFVLAPFQPTDDLSLHVNDMVLVPIPGIKIGLNDSRHFAISKRHPHGKTTFAALQKGLKKLMDRGVVRKAYQQSGFYNAKTRNWKRIN